MILADKIILLRKRNGWSQEELADMLKVSRQSVSKWESAQSTPELNRIIEMSKIFSVSTDYLIKDEMEEIEFSDGYVNDNDLRKVSMEEANEFIDLSRQASSRVSLGVSLLILSPTILLGLVGAVEGKRILITENVANTIGTIFLISFIAIAIALFISTYQSLKEYEFLEKDDFDTEYGVKGMAEERREIFKPSFLRGILIGVPLCILSVIPVLLTGFMENPDPFMEVMAVVFLLFIIAIGVNLIVRVSIIKESYEQLLQIGEYHPDSKKENKIVGPLISILWLVIVAIYFGYSFITKNWHISWVIFPIGGFLTGIISIISQMVKKR